MSRSSLFLLSLLAPVALGAVTIVGVMSLSGAPVRTLERAPGAIESKTSDPRARHEEEAASPSTRESGESLQTPPRTGEKARPVAKPRTVEPEASGPVLFAALRQSNEAHRCS